MKITTSRKDLVIGTEVVNRNGDYRIYKLKRYDNLHNYYNANVYELDDEGEKILVGEISLTPSDLIGNEII